MPKSEDNTRFGVVVPMHHTWRRTITLASSPLPLPSRGRTSLMARAIRKDRWCSVLQQMNGLAFAPFLRGLSIPSMTCLVDLFLLVVAAVLCNWYIFHRDTASIFSQFRFFAWH